jgi:hypothetical protein
MSAGVVELSSGSLDLNDFAGGYRASFVGEADPPPQERSKQQQARRRQARLPTLSQRLKTKKAAHAPVFQRVRNDP